VTGVVVQNLSKSFGSVGVLHNVSVEACEGEFMALVGPSGCGKSTLLRCIAGLEAINGGTISIGGRVVNNLDPKERGAAMVFQNYALYPHMTVRQNMAFSLKLRGGSADEIAAGVSDAARILGLTDYLDRYPRQLSGGQRQRVAMGRAIVRKPSVFLFDEPLSNLDAALRVQMRAEIRALHKRLGITSIYVTHDQVEAMTMADRIVVMRNGVVEQAGPPLELYDRPRNEFVATFIGSPAMNLLEGQLAQGVFALADGQRINFPNDKSVVARAKLGIRPEHIAIADNAAANSIRATVETCESTGATSYLACKLAGAPVIVTVPHRIVLETGQQTHLIIAPENMHVFDVATGSSVEVVR
jgi:multiple sugar transport system ATP-binding protein